MKVFRPDSRLNGAVFLTVVLVVSAGCIGFSGDDSEPHSEIPTTDNSITQTEIQSPKRTATGSPKSTEIEENEFVVSGQEFNELVESGLAIHRTKFVDSQAYPNNTVDVSIGMYSNTNQYADGSLRSSVMDVTQSVATAVAVRTTPEMDMAMNNGTDGLLYEPEEITVHVYSTEDKYVGEFEINPNLARAYMDRQFSSSAFADHVLSSFASERDVLQGDQAPSWYLNTSQLRNWEIVYINEVAKLSDPDNHGYNRALSTAGLSFNPEKFTIRHEIQNWDADDMGQYATSAEATIYGSYWRATARSWSLPPKRILVYIHVNDKDDLRGYMDRKHVYELLSAGQMNQTTLTRYQQSAETKFVEDED